MAVSTPLRIGILGAAEIARAFVRAMTGSPLVTVAAVASRTAEKADAFARGMGIARSFGSYDALLADPGIDAIYNPLPNSMHAEWTIRAAQAGKHVLCEKPLAVSEAEARAMFAAGSRNGVHVVEGYPYLAQPMTLQVRDLVRSGAVGQVRLIRSSFGVYFDDAENIRLKPSLAGGATMDAGSYATSFVRVMAGERPVRAHAVAQWAGTGVDQTLVGSFEFASGLLAQVAASFATGYHRHGQIAGDSGSIETMFLNHPPVGGPAAIQIRRGRTAATPIEVIPVPEGNGFLLEAESFARMVAADDPAAWTGATQAESVDVAAMLEALLASARQGRPLDIPPA